MNFGPDHKITKLGAQLQTVEDELVAAILEEESLSKLDRLWLIESYGLYTTAPFVHMPLRDKYAEQLKEIAIRKGAKFFAMYEWPLIDDTDRSEGERISFANELSMLLHDIKEDRNALVTILKDRATEAELKITYEQLESDIYDWCVSKGKIGFSYCW